MKGICFIEPLHRKTVKGLKVQTRRIIVSRTGFFQVCSKNGAVTDIWQTDANEWTGENLIPVNPRYKVGEIVYLKEPYYEWGDWDSEDGQYSYKFDNPDKIVPYWENKLFMPASAARHWIKITGVHAERLQDISGYDCIKEGIEHTFPKAASMTQAKIDYDSAEPGLRKAYAILIDKINGRGTWDSNPWVWVYDYELTQQK